MAADFEAAFETVSWSYMRAVLKGLNFGESFIKLINAMYFNNENFSRILLNGYLGDKINLNRGIRQGDPVSGHLFNIAVMVLERHINNSSKLTGIRLDCNSEVRISQYADDTILFLENTHSSINGVIEELSEFSEQSGLRINWDKTSCMCLGCTHPQNTNSSITQQLKWVNEMKVLGIFFKNNINNIADENVERKLVTIEKEIAQWKRRNITPVGKITVIKSLLLAKLVHLFLALPNPSQAYIKKIEHIFFRFLWDGKPDRIKRNKIIQSLESDGLCMIHLPSFIDSLKISWIKRVNGSSDIWTALTKMQQLDPERMMTCSVTSLNEVKKSIKNIFWKEVTESVIRFHKSISLENNEILREPIWFSDYTKFKKSRIKKWDDQGLRFIGDLFNPRTGNIMTRDEIRLHYRISMTFLCYESLIRSLPASIRQTVQITFERPNIPFKLQLCLSNLKFNRICYSLFVNEIREKCEHDKKVENKWMAEINFHTKGSLVNVRKATSSPYLLYLHYRIIRRIITTNKLLHVIHISPDNLCTFCKHETETIEHLFWRCVVTKQFIEKIDRELFQNFQIHFRHRVDAWFFPRDLDKIQILIITIAKATIYKARNDGESPNITHFWNYLRSEARKEQFSCRLKNKDTFQKKWKSLRNIVS